MKIRRAVRLLVILAVVIPAVGCQTAPFRVQEVRAERPELFKNLPPYRAMVAFHFNRAADPATLRKIGAVQVDMMNTGSQREAKNVRGKFWWKNDHTVAIFVSDDDINRLLGPLGAELVQYKVRVVGGPKYVTDSGGQGLDGDGDGEPGGVYKTTVLGN